MSQVTFSLFCRLPKELTTALFIEPPSQSCITFITYYYQLQSFLLQFIFKKLLIYKISNLVKIVYVATLTSEFILNLAWLFILWLNHSNKRSYSVCIRLMRLCNTNKIVLNLLYFRRRANQNVCNFTNGVAFFSVFKIFTQVTCSTIPSLLRLTSNVLLSTLASELKRQPRVWDCFPWKSSPPPIHSHDSEEKHSAGGQT